MAETKDEISAERDDLREENNRLRAQLAAAGRQPGQSPAAHQFVLSEGDRQELVMHGVANIGGKRMTREDVVAALHELSDDQPIAASEDDNGGIWLGDTEPVDKDVPPARTGSVEGVDFIYPSVAPGYIDPDVAGTPGVSGPPLPATADTKQAAPVYRAEDQA